VAPTIAAAAKTKVALEGVMVLLFGASNMIGAQVAADGEGAQIIDQVHSWNSRLGAEESDKDGEN